MTEKEVSRYLYLASRQTYILLHSGASWRPEWEQELAEIDMELAKLRKKIDQEHRRREAAACARC